MRRRALFERLKEREREAKGIADGGGWGGWALGSCFIPFLEDDGGLNLLEKVAGR